MNEVPIEPSPSAWQWSEEYQRYYRYYWNERTRTNEFQWDESHNIESNENARIDTSTAPGAYLYFTVFSMLLSVPSGTTIREQSGRTKSTSHPTYSKTSSQQPHIYEIPGLIRNKHHVNALGDSCADKNYMKAAYARKLRLDIDKTQRTPVTVGSGRSVSTVGTSVVPFRFRDEAQEYPLVFHLLPDCIHDVVLGRPFLKATKTFQSLANRTRRVIRRVVDYFAYPSCSYLGDNASRFSGLLNGQAQEALADSGSQVLIIDEAYALDLGLPIDRGHKNRTRLRFADNTTKMTSGMTFGVRWQFGNGYGSEEYTLDFHILKDSPAPIILNNDFLFDTDSFSEFDAWLLDENAGDDEKPCFFFIGFDPKYYSQKANLESRTISLRDRELLRRGQEDDRITELPIEQQSTAREAELRRREQWEHTQRDQIAASEAIDMCQNDSGRPKSPRRSRWKFKLRWKKDP